MAGAIPPPPPAPKLGWDTQSPLTIPKAGLFLVPGAGLAGRTAGGKLFLDTASAAVAEYFQCFAPGAVTARTVDKWRNRRPSQDGTLSVLDVFAATAPTPDAAPAANYWRLVVTDSQGNNVVVPLSQTNANLHSLDRSAGVGFVQPFVSTVAGGTPNGTAFAMRFRPTQGMVIGGATITGYLINLDGGANAKISGMRVRAVLCDATGAVIATSLVWSTGTYDSNGNESWQFSFDRAQQLTAGTDYYLALDCGVDLGLHPSTQMYLASASPNTIQAGTPARLFGATDTVGAISGSSPNVIWCLRLPGQGYTTASTVTGAALVAKQIAGDGSNAFGDIVQNADGSAGLWQLNGTASGVAPIQGDLTFAFSAIGAPAAGSGGSDLNIRAVILP